MVTMPSVFEVVEAYGWTVDIVERFTIRDGLIHEIEAIFDCLPADPGPGHELGRPHDVGDGQVVLPGELVREIALQPLRRAGWQRRTG